jgi:hypothetical protein
VNAPKGIVALLVYTRRHLRRWSGPRMHWQR